MLSGGSGKRLWPMSNDSRSKQFLRVLDDEEGQSISMLQRNWRLLSELGLSKDAYICASRAQREVIEAQLGDVPFIEEPTRRDTFPAIALASLYLADEVGCSDDEPVVVLPIDPMVDDAYFRSVIRLPQVLEESHCHLALMGVEPTEPTSKYGYVRVSGSKNENWHLADGFTEKPDEALAKQLIADGALWNCGVFCFRLGYLRQFLMAGGYPSNFHELNESFATVRKASFDYEVVEKTASIAVLPFAGSWKDLGTWEALCTEMKRPFVGNGTAVECEDTHVINELGIPLVAAGLKDAIVVATPDGILVSDKRHSAGIKNTVSELSGRPMFEERSWGTYRVLDYQKLEDGTEVLTKCIELLPGRNISYQKHLLRSEVWTILQGRGELILGDKLLRMEPGDVYRVYADQWHAIRALEPLMFIEVQRGSELVEEDIIRRFLTWEETMEFYKSMQ